MKKLFLFILLCGSMVVLADKVKAPDWMDALMRENIYPAEKYYTGFASSSANKGEDKATLYDRVQQNARVSAVSSIQVSVEQTVDRYIKNIQSHGTASTTDIMTSYAETRTSIKDIPGLKVDIWENPKTGEVSAFAWIKVSDLSNRLMRRIAANTGKIETELRNIEMLVAKGEKVQARNNLPAIQTMLADVESDQRVMLCIDASVTDEDLSMDDVNKLKDRYRALNAELKNGIAIFLDCKADLFGSNFPAFKGEIQGALSPFGCSFVNSPEEADWIIIVITTTREYNTTTYGNLKTYFVYVDANIAIDKGRTHQRIYENKISEKGNHTLSNEQAARDGYKKISPKISAIIKEHIQ